VGPVKGFADLDLDVAFERVERHSYRLEDARLREVYACPVSSASSSW